MLNKEIEKLDNRIAELIDLDGELRDIYQIVTSVPGVRCRNAVCLVVYTDNFHRFNHNPRKIACYYGIAPFGRGRAPACMLNRMYITWQTGKLRPCCCKLRWQPSDSIRFFPNTIRGLGRGKKMQVALNNVKNKLIHIITYILSLLWSEIIKFSMQNIIYRHNRKILVKIFGFKHRKR